MAIAADGCQPKGCECPNFFDVAASIDWVGDGTQPTQYPLAERVEYADPLVLQVTTRYDIAAGAPNEQDAIAQRMKDAGLWGFELADGSWQFQSEDWYVLLTFPQIWVRIVDDDQNAAEILSAILDALGTIP